MRRVPLFGCCVAFLGLLLPASSAEADPVVTGVIQVYGPLARFGGSFSSGDVTVFGAYGIFDAYCAPCRPGTELSFSGSYTYLSGEGRFSSPRFVLPDGVPAGIWTIAMPFSFVGATFPSSTGFPVHTLETSGIVTGTFWRVSEQVAPPGGLFQFASATYVAGAEPSAPVPEPASVLLIASGLGGLCAWRRRPAKEK